MVRFRPRFLKDGAGGGDDDGVGGNDEVRVALFRVVEGGGVDVDGLLLCGG